MQLVENIEFIKEDYNLYALATAEYDNCTFTGCNFESSNLTGIVFTHCRFVNCNMGNANIKSTAFKEVAFTECKLLGMNFGIADPFLFTVGFEKCNLQFASFFRMKMKQTKFISCNLREADFVEADLTAALFKDCELYGAVFENTILEKTDFRLAVNYAFDPEMNRIKKAKFSREGLHGLLHKYDISIE
jgi:fluoroquinolone resistance protein